MDSSKCDHERGMRWRDPHGGGMGFVCRKCNAYLDNQGNELPETTPNSDMLAVLFVILVFLMGVVVGAAAVYSVQGG